MYLLNSLFIVIMVPTKQMTEDYLDGISAQHFIYANKKTHHSFQRKTYIMILFLCVREKLICDQAKSIPQSVGFTEGFSHI